MDLILKRRQVLANSLKPKKYAWYKYTVDSVNYGKSGPYGLAHAIAYGETTTSNEWGDTYAYGKTPTYNYLNTYGTRLDTSRFSYSTYTKFKPIIGNYYCEVGSRRLMRYIPSTASVAREIKTQYSTKQYYVGFTHSYEVNETYLESEDENAYPKNAWSGSSIYYESLGEVS